MFTTAVTETMTKAEMILKGEKEDLKLNLYVPV